MRDVRSSRVRLQDDLKEGRISSPGILGRMWWLVVMRERIREDSSAMMRMSEAR